MIRRGQTDPAPEPSADHPLFSPDALAKLRAIEQSELWEALARGIQAQREALLATPLNLEKGETLQARWGAIQQLSLLLHGGPQLVMQYAARPDEEAQEEEEDGGRTYVARAHRLRAGKVG
jgi:hypothetical protein